MAWIESHQSLLTHRKTIRAATLLKVNRYQLIGHLHALWWWALDNAPDGVLAELTAEEIAEATGWPTKRGAELVQALVEAGFIDVEPARLHDWMDYAGRLIVRRTAERERQRTRRIGEQRTPYTFATGDVR